MVNDKTKKGFILEKWFDLHLLLCFIHNFEIKNDLLIYYFREEIIIKQYSIPFALWIAIFATFQ